MKSHRCMTTGAGILLAILVNLWLGGAAAIAEGDPGSETVLLEDGFRALEPGKLMPAVGAHTEYHFLPEAGPKGEWAVTTFLPPWQRAWEVRRDKGSAVMAQTAKNDAQHCHPMIAAGDELWTDYTVLVRFVADDPEKPCGLAFRYQNDRCYYFFGVQGDEVLLKRVKDEVRFHVPDEQILARAKHNTAPNQTLTARVGVTGENIRAELNGVVLEARDAAYSAGKVALLSDGPARFLQVRVTTSAAAARDYEARKALREEELARLQAANPKPVVWKKISTEGFGAGRNLRFGDLDGDGKIDVLIGQILHHGPGDGYSELSCLTAMTFDGKILWRIGEPDPEKYHLTNDVGFQIHDIDRDGRNEVVFCMNQEIVVADGATGKVKYKTATPESKPEANKFPRILGDCLFFCDLRGRGHAQDIIIKDRYWHFWALTDRLELQWQGACRTGHYPFAADVDGDGHDELAIGYALFDHDGKLLWNLEDQIQDHADGVAILNFGGKSGSSLRLFYAASDAGALYVDPVKGKILKRHWIGHVQNPAMADFRPDLPGLETVSINFWGNQGILHFFDAEGNIYHRCEPNQFGSMCLPVNWTGRPGEYFVHNPNVKLGGMFDGWGRCVVKFPDDGHPDMCNAVLDLSGDCRDEVVVWDPHAIWVYTQDDNPKPGKLYKPRRNPLYNYSNYQATVSSPGWSE